MKGVIKDKRGFLQTNQQLQILKEADEGKEPEPLQDVYAMGDCAHIQDHFLPATAQVRHRAFLSASHFLTLGDSQVANQQGIFLAKVLSGQIADPAKRRFEYFHRGEYIGTVPSCELTCVT